MICHSVKRDIQDAADVHKHFLKKGIHPTSLLGGCWTSWMSDLVANDWDFFADAIHQPAFEQLGYSFHDAAASGYVRKKNVTVNDWVVSRSPVLGREQVILVGLGNNLVWCSFDYQHAMLGIEGHGWEEISVGLDAIWQKRLVKNYHGNVKNYRTSFDIQKKMEARWIWGAPYRDVLERWEGCVDEYLRHMGVARSRRVDLHKVPVAPPSPAPSHKLRDDPNMKFVCPPDPCYMCDKPSWGLNQSGVPTCVACAGGIAESSF